jgi:hypothetical protein
MEVDFLVRSRLVRGVRLAALVTASYSSNDSSYTTLGSTTDSTFSSGKVGVRTYGTNANVDAVKVVKD